MRYLQFYKKENDNDSIILSRLNMKDTLLLHCSNCVPINSFSTVIRIESSILIYDQLLNSKVVPTF